ncbi:MAG: putative bifunctional diguanylate cyclase/phosphodiesterase [Gammaproteobacteria bacterium]
MTMVPISSSRPVVLIADDDPTTRLIAREVLEQAGMDVVEACEGEEALARFSEQTPDLVLLDVDMPLIDGFTVCQKIRASEDNRSVPICIITGLDDFESADKAYHLGATDFISKPIDWSVLAYRVRYLLRASNALNDIHGLVAALPDVIFVLDENGNKYLGPTGLEDNVLDGIDALKGVSFDELFDANVKDSVKETIGLALESSRPQILEHFYTPRNVHIETRFVARDRNTVLAIVRDITQRKASESQVFDLAYYDRLTGLPNRHLFSQELDDVLNDARTQKRQFAMMFVDLDRFKRINDTLGHSIGDELLKAVADRLQSCTRPSDGFVQVDGEYADDIRLARLGGDEFVLMLDQVDGETAASKIADRVISALSLPFNCKGHQLVVTPSIGIAFYPKDGRTKDELLMNADSAMYRAKAAGRNTHKFYSGSMRLRSLHRLSMEEELRKAIDNEQFELFYQPKVDLSNWEIVGAEALIRWQHNERGWISPADFIPVAEETGLILPIGRWVMEAACEQLKKWRHTSLNKLCISVNVSSQQIYSDGLTDLVSNIINSVGIDPGKLELEITESMLMRDIESTIDTLNELKEFGVGLSIDDFGTGYSSLSYLKRFPIDALKIDSSFVRELQDDNNDAAICAAILAMAHKLDLKVVAEGVELVSQVDYLRSQNCDLIQGFFISKPVAATDFESLYLEHTQAGTSAVV